ncbi:prepilin peptidase [Stratiformator vulcanicus]|uniref:Type 4 prepilin-like proteins leader peptide-processing enzyme n=1 Tax=Stratiformator vulcanicus TaxID=2527980 RepID=A0A517R622_9PLAN|nr:A24 family peptidase [Stratiformator vulcanicus]QDT39321.1 Type 4 prepilin-like proteins leader peptide-processing enzyme [Stratiformator vulcanicus]
MTTAVVISALVGIAAGGIAYFWATTLTRRGVDTGNVIRTSILAACGWGIFSGLLYAGLAYAVLEAGWQTTPDQHLSSTALPSRLVFHGTLLFFLLTATITDFRDYVIPDWITVPGMLLGIIGLTAAGHVDLAPIWVDWYNPLPTPQPPQVPDFVRETPHWHGLAVSIAGLLVGGGVVWLARAACSTIAGRDGLGFGDVTLMAMAGAFLGWQPVLLAIAIAPLTGIVVALAVAVSGLRSYIAFGPYLACGCVVVLLTWKFIWVAPIRDLMGDAIGMAVLGGLIAAISVGMLLLLRGYHSIPVLNAPRSADGELGDE